MRSNQHFVRVFLNFIVCIFMCSNFVMAQAQKEIFLIKADSNWGKEVFYFPLSFAPEIKFQGYEEARFPKGWAKKDSSSFWSYVFAWQIELDSMLTEADIEKNLTYYFDGLMSAQSSTPKTKLPATIVILVQKGAEKSSSFLTGTVQIYDAFTLKAPLLLNVTVEQNFCAARNKLILLFRFSPKAPKHFIWKKLNALTILDAVFEKDQCR